MATPKFDSEVVNGFTLQAPPTGGGGKAGKGKAKTASVQLRKDGKLVKNFQYPITDKAKVAENQAAALVKAREWAEKN